MSFLFVHTEVPVQLLLALSSDAKVSQAEKSTYQKKAVADTTVALSIIEKHLFSRTYLVGERVTIADISLYAVIGAILKLNAVDVASLFPAVFRTYMTVGSQKLVTSVAGPPTVPSTAPTVSASGSGSASVGVVSNRIDAGTFPGKWQRNRTRVKELLYKDVSMIGQEVTCQGWVRTSRFAENHAIMFVELTDGSTVRGIQLVLTAATTEVSTCALYEWFEDSFYN